MHKHSMRIILYESIMVLNKALSSNPYESITVVRKALLPIIIDVLKSCLLHVLRIHIPIFS